MAVAFFDEGVFGREAGVFGREVAFADGVRDLAFVVVVTVAIVRGSVDGALRAPVPLDGVRGVGALECVPREVDEAVVVAVVVDGRVAGDDVDFDGDPGVVVGVVLMVLVGAVNVRDIEAGARTLLAGAAAAGAVGVA